MPDTSAIAGAALAGRFSDASNGVVGMPAIEAIYARDRWRIGACGYYRDNGIHVCPPLCAPLGRHGRQWSWPGYAVDRTPLGVVCHEMGHHADWLLSDIKGAYGGNFSVDMRAQSGEPPITTYKPNDWEWFAEIFRLFVTNARLIEAIRPRTFDLLASYFPAWVSAAQPWEATLQSYDAPERTMSAARNRVAKAQRGFL